MCERENKMEEKEWNYKEKASLMWYVLGKPKNFLSASAFSL
jgi:hypothetical protein